MNTNKYFPAVLLLTMFTASVHAQVSTDRNFVSKTIVNKAGVTAQAQVDALPAAHRNKTVNYIDGLGRPLQSIVVQGSSDQRDIITPVEFDNYGRPVKKFLPYTDMGGTSYGSFRANAYADQGSFYSPANTAIPDVARDANPYEQSFLEFSPQSRLLESGAPGQTWQPGNGHAVKQVNSQNTLADGVKKWVMSGTLPVAGDYLAGDLYKLITIDEQGHRSIEYKDRENKVVLKKVQLAANAGDGHTGWLSTYYVYDDFNLLRFVIPPKAVAAAAAANWSLTDPLVINELCFIYTYDAQGRMITKKVPGAAITEMVYDIRDRLVFSQDGNQRGIHRWLVTFYDTRNRPVMTAYYDDPAATRASLQNGMDNAAAANASLSYTFPGIEDLVVASHDNRPLYQAKNSITLESGFDTGENGATTLEIDPALTGGTQVTAVNNPLPGIPENKLTPLTYTFYDDYSYTGALPAIAGDLNAPQAGSSTTAVANAAASKMTKGLVTGTRVRILGTNQWLTSSTYYTERGQPLQVVSENYTGGKDVTTNLYDFEGKLLSSYVRHRNPASATTPETRILTVMNYDHAGHVLDIGKKINDEGALKTIVQNHYNTLGQLTTKTLGNSLDNLVYDYNIRGWMLGANRAFVKATGTGNYFGFELGYDQPGSIVPGTGYLLQQYNGNIAGTIWRSKGDNVGRKYDYAYDPVNRLTGAEFTQQPLPADPWTKSAVDFTVSGLGYDENGNIMTMKQQGMSNGGIIPLDNLKYGYGTSNKLQFVTDAANNPQSTLGDFKEITNNESQDYWYDPNGNLTKDNNKNIASITYNHLNLPELITITSKGSIQYTYDASGRKLRKVVKDITTAQPKTTTTDYIAGFEYKDNKLQFFSHEEGRVRALIKEGAPVTFAYDYFEKDHLGNVRVVLTENSDVSTYVATMETASAAKETSLFSNLDETRVPKPAGYPADGAANDNKSVAKLNAQGSAKKIGPSIVLRVMAGDTIQIGVKAFYKSTGPVNKKDNTVIPENMVADLVAAFGGNAAAAGNHGSASPGSQTPFNTNFYNNDYQRLKEKDPDQHRADKPRAYLNFVLFDDQFKLVEQNSGVKQVKGEPDQLQTLTQDKMAITKTGFLYVYTSNESPQDVFFDNVVVTQASGPLLEETHYYPFGLTMAGISSNALKGTGYPENRKQYNAIEHTIDLDLNQYDAFYRNLDPQIGRWNQIDPKTEASLSESPYVSMGNNPVKNVDPFGDLFFGLFGSTSAQRKAARELAAETGGRVVNNLSRKIQVSYTTIEKVYSEPAGAAINTAIVHTVNFRANGRVDGGSAVANAYIDKQADYWSNHRIDQNGKVQFMRASGRADYVPVEALLVPLPPVLTMLRGLRLAKAMETGGMKILSKSEMAEIWGGGVRMTEDQAALNALVREATLGGRRALTSSETNVVRELAEEVSYPGFRASPADMSPLNNHWIGGPHIHMPGIGNGHIPIIP